MNELTKIFILDDDRYFGTFLQQNLWEHFRYVSYFQSEKECLRALVSERPEVLILDHKLENSNGLQIMDEVKRLCGDNTYVLYLSSQEYVHITIKALKSGAIDYLEKCTCTSESLNVSISKLIQMTNNFTKPLDVPSYRSNNMH